MQKKAAVIVITVEKAFGWEVDLQIRTVAAILMWFVAALLILNRFFRSRGIGLTSVALLLLAVLLYFIPKLRK